MVDVTKAKPVEEEDEIFFQEIVGPALTELQAQAKTWVHPVMPEFEEDPLDLTPEQEAAIYQQIRRSRGHDD